MKIKLLSCEDCYSENITIKHYPEIFGEYPVDETWSVRCADCGREYTFFGSKEKFIHDWNGSNRKEVEVEVQECD